MFKQTYIKPELDIEDVVVENMLATSDVYISGEITNEDAKMAGKRMGTWGDRWN